MELNGFVKFTLYFKGFWAVMNEKLQELYEAKIRIYESIISKIKDIDFEILVDFEIEFKKLEELNRRITDDPELSKQQLLKMRLWV